MIPLAKPAVGNCEISALDNVLSSGCVAGTCQEVRNFEEEFAKYIGSKFAVATSSCTAALHVACIIGNAKLGTLTAVPSYTFPATGSAPMYCDSTIDLIDVNRDTWNMLHKELGPYHDIIMPVHSFGNPCDMPAIMDIAEDTDAFVIEDSACAVASTLNGKHTGTFGDIGCYSFYGIKELCTGEGGMLVTDNKEYYELAKSLVDFGKTTSMPLPKFEHLGYNYRLSGIQAAVGRVQLNKLPKMHCKRAKIAELYNKFIDDELDGLAYRQEHIKGAVPSYQRYSVLLSQEIDRNEVMIRMNDVGIQTSIGTFDLSQIPLYGISDKCPMSTLLFNQSISLPMYPGLTQSNAETVMDEFELILADMDGF